MTGGIFVRLQVWGTPDQVKERVLTIQDNTYNDSYIAVFSYAGMAPDDAEASARLFAREVIPDLQALAPAYDRLGTPA